MLRAYGAAADPATMTLDAYLADWLTGIRPTIAPPTFVSYSGHVRLHISPLLGGMIVARIRAADVRRLIADRLSTGLSPATVRRILTTLQMALGQGVREGALVSNVAARMPLPRAERQSIRAMTDNDAERILDAVKDDSLEALYVLLLGVGLRAGEAVGLDWRDVDFERETVFIRQGKTRASTRTVPLPDFVLGALRAHRARAVRIGPAEPVFVGERRAERLRVDVAGHRLQALLERAGLPRMRVHDFRHGTATLLLARGVPMRDIADLLGHATPSVTANVYAHVTEEMRRKAVRTLDRPARAALGSHNGSRRG
jgi:integrase